MKIERAEELLAKYLPSGAYPTEFIVGARAAILAAAKEGEQGYADEPKLPIKWLNVPDRIVHAAAALSVFMTENNFAEWEFVGCASRAAYVKGKERVEWMMGIYDDDSDDGKKGDAKALTLAGCLVAGFEGLAALDKAMEICP